MASTRILAWLCHTSDTHPPLHLSHHSELPLKAQAAQTFQQGNSSTNASIALAFVYSHGFVVPLLLSLSQDSLRCQPATRSAYVQAYPSSLVAILSSNKLPLDTSLTCKSLRLNGVGLGSSPATQKIMFWTRCNGHSDIVQPFEPPGPERLGNHDSELTVQEPHRTWLE